MRRAASALALWALLLISTVALAEQSATPSAPSPDAALDRKVADILRDVHNQGAELYNGGDAAGCFHLLEGCLLTVRPLLEHHPEVQTLISDGLKSAKKEETAGRRAFALHSLIESVRGKLKSTKPPEVVTKTPMPTVDPKEGRLGSEKAGKVVSEFFSLASRDKAVNLSRGGKFAEDHPVWLTARLFLKDWLIATTGGSAKPSPEPAAVVAALRGVGISADEYKAGVAVMRRALETQRVDATDVDAVVKALEGYQNEMLAPAEPIKDGVGKLMGVVTLNGEPLSGVDLQFVRTESNTFEIVDVKAGENGSYTIVELKAGKYLIVVDGKGVPDAYRRTTTTPLKVEVKPGSNTFNLGLSK